MDLLAGAPQEVIVKSTNGIKSVKISSEDYYFKQSEKYKLKIKSLKDKQLTLSISKSSPIFTNDSSDFSYVCSTKEVDKLSIVDHRTNLKGECIDKCGDETDSQKRKSATQNAYQN